MIKYHEYKDSLDTQKTYVNLVTAFGGWNNDKKQINFSTIIKPVFYIV